MDALSSSSPSLFRSLSLNPSLRTVLSTPRGRKSGAVTGLSWQSCINGGLGGQTSGNPPPLWNHPAPWRCGPWRFGVSPGSPSARHIHPFVPAFPGYYAPKPPLPGREPAHLLAEERVRHPRAADAGTRGQFLGFWVYSLLRNREADRSRRTGPRPWAGCWRAGAEYRGTWASP